MEQSLEELLLKYSFPGGRYAVYPSPSLWKCNFEQSEWMDMLEAVCLSEQGLDVYVHIPFCKSLCTFCGCNIKVTSDHGVEVPYLETLLKEWDSCYNASIEKTINSLHLGGGTPHFFSPGSLQRLFGHILKSRRQDFVGTMEVDPREISKEHLEIAGEWGFRRIVLGVQDFNQKVLRNVNREQSFERVLSVAEQARGLGFEEIVTEWIYGLPLQTPETLREALAGLGHLNPEGVAFYPLAGVPWQNAGQSAFGHYNPPDIKERVRLYCAGWGALSEQGFQHIGMGYFFQPDSPTYKAFLEGRLGRNSTGLVTDRSPALIGIGAGSISRAENLLWQNEKVVDKYEQKIFKGNHDPVSFHRQSLDERQREMLFEQLLCKSKFSAEPLPVHEDLFGSLLKDGILEEVGGGAKVTSLGRHFLKTVFHACDPYSYCP